MSRRTKEEEELRMLELQKEKPKVIFVKKEELKNYNTSDYIKRYSKRCVEAYLIKDFCDSYLGFSDFINEDDYLIAPEGWYWQLCYTDNEYRNYRLTKIPIDQYIYHYEKGTYDEVDDNKTK